MVTTRVSDATRRDTWELMLDLERQIRYYANSRTATCCDTAPSGLSS